MQVLRINKLDLFSVICRCYGTQRPHRNYYEILEVSPNCSQKEIRKAFITLSKKWHPDIIGNKGHDKFVKLQEAYDILGKENTRKQYDMNLKYNPYSSYSSPQQSEPYFYSGRTYRSHREWEEHMARGNWRPRQSDYGNGKTIKMVRVYVMSVLMILVLQFFILHARIFHTSRYVQQEYQKNYNLLRKNIEGLTLDQQIKLVEDRYNLSQTKEEEDNK